VSEGTLIAAQYFAPRLTAACRGVRWAAAGAGLGPARGWDPTGSETRRGGSRDEHAVRRTLCRLPPRLAPGDRVGDRGAQA